MYMYIVYTLYVHVFAMYVHVLISCITAILREYIGGISLYLHNGRFLHNSIVYTHVKGGTGKYAVATTEVVYAYNMWYPCTVYVHVNTLRGCTGFNMRTSGQSLCGHVGLALILIFV